MSSAGPGLAAAQAASRETETGEVRLSALPSLAPCPRRAWHEVVSRIVDVVGGLTLLIALLPVLLVIAALVRLSSPGPLLYRQRRVGRDGRLFELVKFRTMHATGGGPRVTAGDDARVTRVGRALRQWKLDELPQLWNVVRGDMALVGPRPEVPEYVRLYTAEQREVLSVRPGVTGLTQLAFRNEEALLAGRSDVERYYIEHIMPLKLDIDRQYVTSRWLGGDLAILLRTVAGVLRG
ncbi:MAG TPA: sugar transferase [Chthonomonadales bacterium]|nr:sugar transferase [Chthonomonadales bacterium]